MRCITRCGADIKNLLRSGQTIHLQTSSSMWLTPLRILSTLQSEAQRLLYVKLDADCENRNSVICHRLRCGALSAYRSFVFRHLHRLSVVAASYLPIRPCKYLPPCRQHLCDLSLHHSLLPIAVADSFVLYYFCVASGIVIHTHHWSVWHRLCDARCHQHDGCGKSKVRCLDCSLYHDILFLQQQLVHPPMLLSARFFV